MTATRETLREATPTPETADIAGLGWEIANEQWMNTAEKAKLAKRIDTAVATALQSLSAELADVKRELQGRDKVFCAKLATGVCDLPDRLATAEAQARAMREALEDAKIEIEAAKLFGGGFYGDQVTDLTRAVYRNDARRALGGTNAE